MGYIYFNLLLGIFEGKYGEVLLDGEDDEIYVLDFGSFMEDVVERRENRVRKIVVKVSVILREWMR